MARDRQLNMRASKKEFDRLDALAVHYGITVTDVIRMLVKRDFDRVKKVRGLK